MARYQVMYWKEFPAHVKAEDGADVVKAKLPDRFMEAIDSAAMLEGSVESADYLEGWAWSEEQERPGGAREVAEAVAAELERAFPPERLAAMVRNRR